MKKREKKHLEGALYGQTWNDLSTKIIKNANELSYWKKIGIPKSISMIEKEKEGARKKRGLWVTEECQIINDWYMWRSAGVEETISHPSW